MSKNEGLIFRFVGIGYLLICISQENHCPRMGAYKGIQGDLGSWIDVSGIEQGVCSFEG